MNFTLPIVSIIDLSRSISSYFSGNPDKPNNEGSTALHLAAGTGQLHCLVFLTNVGGNVYAINDNGEAPMQTAVRKGRRNCVRHLETLVTHQLAQDREKVRRTQTQAKKEADKRIRKKTKLLQELDREYERKTAKQKKTTAAKQIQELTYAEDEIQSEDDMSNQDENNNDSNNFKQNKPSFSKLTGVTKDISETSEYETMSNPDESDITSSIRDSDEQYARNRSVASDDILFSRGAFDDNSTSGYTDFTSLSNVTKSSRLTNLTQNSKVKNTTKSSKSNKSSRLLLNGNNTPSSISKSLSSIPLSTGILKSGGIVDLSNSRLSSQGDDILLSQTLLGMERGGISPNSLNSNKIIVEAVSPMPPSKRIGEPLGTVTISMGPLYTFLHALELDEYRQMFLNEKIDLNACLLCEESDLREIGLPVGPRKKIIDGIKKRKEILRNSVNEFKDSAA